MLAHSTVSKDTDLSHTGLPSTDPPRTVSACLSLVTKRLKQSGRVKTIYYIKSSAKEPSLTLQAQCTLALLMVVNTLLKMDMGCGKLKTIRWSRQGGGRTISLKMERNIRSELGNNK